MSAGVDANYFGRWVYTWRASWPLGILVEQKLTFDISFILKKYKKFIYWQNI
jgi:hypothetical protein